MANILTINFSIPLSDKKSDGSCISFSHWIPEKESDAILVSRGDKEVRIYVDKSCVSSLHDVRWWSFSGHFLKSGFIIRKEVFDEKETKQVYPRI